MSERHANDSIGKLSLGFLITLHWDRIVYFVILGLCLALSGYVASVSFANPFILQGSLGPPPRKTAYPLLTSPPNEATQIVSGVSVGSV